MAKEIYHWLMDVLNEDTKAAEKEAYGIASRMTAILRAAQKTPEEGIFVRRAKRVKASRNGSKFYDTIFQIFWVHPDKEDKS